MPAAPQLGGRATPKRTKTHQNALFPQGTPAGPPCVPGPPTQTRMRVSGTHEAPVPTGRSSRGRESTSRRTRAMMSESEYRRRGRRSRAGPGGSVTRDQGVPRDAKLMPTPAAAPGPPSSWDALGTGELVHTDGTHSGWPGGPSSWANVTPSIRYQSANNSPGPDLAHAGSFPPRTAQIQRRLSGRPSRATQSLTFIIFRAVSKDGGNSTRPRTPHALLPRSGTAPARPLSPRRLSALTRRLQPRDAVWLWVPPHHAACVPRGAQAQAGAT